MGVQPTFGPALAKNMVVTGDSLGLYGFADSDLTELWRYPESGLPPVKGVHAEHRQQATIQGRVDENVVLVFSSDTINPSVVWNLTRLDPDLPPTQMVVGSVAVAPQPQVVTHRDLIGVIDRTDGLVFYDLDLEEIAWDPESGPVEAVTTTESYVVVAATIGDAAPPDIRVRWLQPGQSQSVHEEVSPGSRAVDVTSGPDLIHLLTEDGYLYTFAAVPGGQPQPFPFIRPPQPGEAPDPVAVVEGLYEALSSGDPQRTYEYLTAAASVWVGRRKAAGGIPDLWDGPIVQALWETHVEAHGLLNAQWTPLTCTSSPRPTGFPGEKVECQATYTNDIMETVGAAPVTEYHSFAVYNGLVSEFFEPLVDFGGGVGPPMPGLQAFDTWLEMTFPEDWERACRNMEPGTFTHVDLECVQFRVDHLDEWAASLQD